MESSYLLRKRMMATRTMRVKKSAMAVKAYMAALAPSDIPSILSIGSLRIRKSQALPIESSFTCFDDPSFGNEKKQILLLTRHPHSWWGQGVASSAPDSARGSLVSCNHFHSAQWAERGRPTRRRSRSRPEGLHRGDITAKWMTDSLFRLFKKKFCESKELQLLWNKNLKGFVWGTFDYWESRLLCLQSRNAERTYLLTGIHNCPESKKLLLDRIIDKRSGDGQIHIYSKDPRAILLQFTILPGHDINRNLSQILWTKYLKTFEYNSKPYRYPTSVQPQQMNECI